MDVLTRTIRGWQLGQALDQGLTLLALQRALAQYIPAIHHSEQGVQYAATSYTQLLENAGVQISMVEEAEAWRNGDAERLMRTTHEEEVQWSEYVDYADVLRHVGRFLNEVHMHKRIQAALGSLTAAEFEEQWHQA
jgi:putative transposase